MRSEGWGAAFRRPSPSLWPATVEYAVTGGDRETTGTECECILAQPEPNTSELAALPWLSRRTARAIARSAISLGISSAMALSDSAAPETPAALSPSTGTRWNQGSRSDCIPFRFTSA